MLSSAFIASFILLVPTFVYSNNAKEILASVHSTIIYVQREMETQAHRTRSRCAIQLVEDSNILKAEFERTNIGVNAKAKLRDVAEILQRGVERFRKTAQDLCQNEKAKQSVTSLIGMLELDMMRIQSELHNLKGTSTAKPNTSTLPNNATGSTTIATPTISSTEPIILPTTTTEPNILFSSTTAPPFIEPTTTAEPIILPSTTIEPISVPPTSTEPEENLPSTTTAPEVLLTTTEPFTTETPIVAPN